MKHSIQIAPSAEARRTLRGKLLTAWAVYWVLFIAFITAGAMLGGSYGMVALAAFACASCWLAACVADSASLMGGSSAIWGAGTLVLGPVGAIIFPSAQLVRLRG